jgi:gamma-butyrobetaine dioxygenase
MLRSVELRGACVRVVWSDGLVADFAAAALWDDAAPEDAPVGGQRMRSVQSLIGAGPARSVAIVGDTVRLDFQRDSITWPGNALRTRAIGETGSTPERILWDRGEDIAGRPPVSYSAYLEDDAALTIALSEVARYGIVRLAGAGTALGELEQTVRRLGFIRETNYGRMFQVRVATDPANLADTAQALEPHTDNPYRDPVPTLQLLHCVRNAGEGGETFFLDGFALARWLRETRPEDFACLARHPVSFAFTAAGGERYETRRPILRLTADGDIAAVYANHRALGTVDFEAGTVARWYEAYLALMAEAGAHARQWSTVLEPGEIVIFDNERILHGRAAFNARCNRLLEGCYADRDGLLATLARLRRSEGKSG